MAPRAGVGMAYLDRPGRRDERPGGCRGVCRQARRGPQPRLVEGHQPTYRSSPTVPVLLTVTLQGLVELRSFPARRSAVTAGPTNTESGARWARTRRDMGSRW